MVAKEKVLSLSSSSLAMALCLLVLLSDFFFHVPIVSNMADVLPTRPCVELIGS